MSKLNGSHFLTLSHPPYPCFKKSRDRPWFATGPTGRIFVVPKTSEPSSPQTTESNATVRENFPALGLSRCKSVHQVGCPRCPWSCRTRGKTSSPLLIDSRERGEGRVRCVTMIWWVVRRHLPSAFRKMDGHTYGKIGMPGPGYTHL